MKQAFKSADEIAQALRDTDTIDTVVHQMAGRDKTLRARLMDVVNFHFVADARTMSDDHLDVFAKELYDVACKAAEPA